MRKLFLLAGVFLLYSLPTQAGPTDSIIFIQQPSGVTVTLWSVMFCGHPARMGLRRQWEPGADI